MLNPQGNSFFAQISLLICLLLHSLHCCFIISGGPSTTQALTSQNPVSSVGSATPTFTFRSTTSGSGLASVTPIPSVSTSTSSSRAQGSRGSLDCLESQFFKMLFQVHVELSSLIISTPLTSSTFTLFPTSPYLNQSECSDLSIFKVKASTTQEISAATSVSSYVYIDWVSSSFWIKTSLK